MKTELRRDGDEKMVYVNIEKEFFEKNKEAAAKKAIKEFDEEGGKDILYFDVKDNETRIDGIEDDGTINVVSDSKLGYISFDVKLSDDDYIEFAGLIIKKLNKFKSAIESVK